jgi:hypothetical protein
MSATTLVFSRRFIAGTLGLTVIAAIVLVHQATEARIRNVSVDSRRATTVVGQRLVSRVFGAVDISFEPEI